MNARAFVRMKLALPNDPLVVTAATLTVDNRLDGRLCVLNGAAGQTITLPLAKGSGTELTFIIGTSAAGQSNIVQRGVSTDIVQGMAFIGIHNNTTGKTFQANQVANANTITLNGTTSGGVNVGDMIWLFDILSGVWAVNINSIGSGTLVTPFSNT